MLKETLRVVYPRKCPGCGAVIAADTTVCDICRPKFTVVESPFCFRCGRHIAEGEAYICTECQNKTHHYVTGFAVFVYDGITQKAMSDLKFNGLAENAEFFADEAAKLCRDRILAFSPKALIPVPIHSSKRALRGYNQAELIVGALADKVGIPTVNDLLQRTKKTSAQKFLGSELRSTNLSSAFSCNLKKYSREHIAQNLDRVLLVDDIYTTGNTMESCTQALIDAGVREVGILSIAIGRNF